MRPGMQRTSPSFRFPFSHLGLVCSWTGPTGGCRGRLHLPTRDVLNRRHNNRLARDKGAGAGRRAGPGGVGRQGSSAVGVGVETSSQASRLSTAFDPRPHAAPLQAAPLDLLPRPLIAPFGPEHRAERSTPCAGGMAVSWRSWLANEGVKHLCLVGWRAKLAWQTVCLCCSQFDSFSECA